MTGIPFGRGRKRGFTRVLVSLDPRQIEVLRREAIRRMRKRKLRRIDAGEVVREAIDAWMFTRSKRGRT
jgi:hypothetical protein